MSGSQLSLLEPVSVLPEGFVYRPELVTPEREVELVEHFAKLDFREFEFQGYLGKRRVVSFGMHYDFAERRVHQAAEIAAFLLPLRERAAGFAGIAAAALEHALVTEYTPGAAIGWHRDRPVFGDVVGISLGSACRFRFRKKHGSGWERTSLVLEPRSAYLLRGPARHQWEHSIPPAEALRYSVTFRSVKSPAASAGR
jgi:alkylated DNA repair dioxygenase AlkB